MDPDCTTVFLVDCYDGHDESARSQVFIELKKKAGFSTSYNRGLIDSCLEAISEYDRLANDLVRARLDTVVVCTGIHPHIRRLSGQDRPGPMLDGRASSSSGGNRVGYVPDLTQARWQQSIDLAADALQHGKRLCLILRYQQGLSPSQLQLDDVPNPISITKSVQDALVARRRSTCAQITIVRVVMDRVNVHADGSRFSSSSTYLTPISMNEALTISVETFIVPFSNVFSAFWELAQRHLDLRSINISGIPMKKSRKQANLGKRFSVSFLYRGSEQNELDRIQDQNEIAEGVVQLGWSSTSSWAGRRSKDVFWSQAPAQFSLTRSILTNIHLVTPSNLCSPLTAPLLKAVLVPNTFLFFSETESGPPSLVLGLHKNCLYMHELAASISEPAPADHLTPADLAPSHEHLQSYLDQFDLVSHILTLRSGSASSSPMKTELRRSLLRQIGALLSDAQLAACGSWSSSRLQTIFGTCLRTVLKGDLLDTDLPDLGVAIEALRNASRSEDSGLLPASLAAGGQATAIYDYMWHVLCMAGTTIRSWSPAHGTAAEMIRIAAGRPAADSNLGEGHRPSTLIEAFWRREWQRKCPSRAALQGVQ